MAFCAIYAIFLADFEGKGRLACIPQFIVFHAQLHITHDFVDEGIFKKIWKNCESQRDKRSEIHYEPKFP